MRAGHGAETPSALLAAGLEALGLALGEDDRRRLLEYVALLERWSRAYSLTALREPAAMITRHVLDSLTVAPFVRAPRVLDVGTGAGLPGVPLAVALPQCRFVLLDARLKPIRFLRHAVNELGLGNVEVVRARVERFRPAAKFDTLVARAVAQMPALLARTRALWDTGGVFLFMKGRRPQAELAAVRAPYAVAAVVRLEAPGVRGARHLVIVERRRGPAGDA